MKDIDRISGDVLDVALRLHRELGPGLLESVYEGILARRLEMMGYVTSRQHPVAVEFDGLRFDCAFRVDLLVDDRLVVEIKSLDRLAPVHGKQLLTYLRLLKQPVGLLINFGGATLIEGVKRVVNNHTPSALSASLRENNPGE